MIKDAYDDNYGKKFHRAHLVSLTFHPSAIVHSHHFTKQVLSWWYCRHFRCKLVSFVFFNVYRLQIMIRNEIALFRIFLKVSL